MCITEITLFIKFIVIIVIGLKALLYLSEVEGLEVSLTHVSWALIEFIHMYIFHGLVAFLRVFSINC